jgi:WD40 repeat protein
VLSSLWLLSLPLFTASGIATESSSSSSSLHTKRSTSWRPRVLTTLREHNAAVRTLAIHDTERFILSGSKDGVVKLWSLGAERSKLTYHHHHPSDQQSQSQRLQSIQAVHFVMRSGQFASCDGTTIHLCDMERGTLLTHFESDVGYLTFEAFDGERKNEMKERGREREREKRTSTKTFSLTLLNTYTYILIMFIPLSL